MPEPFLLMVLDHSGAEEGYPALNGWTQLAPPAHAHPNNPAPCLNPPFRQTPTSSSAPKGIFGVLQEQGIPGWRGKVPAGPGPQGKMLCRVAGKAREVTIRHNIIIVIKK